MTKFIHCGCSAFPVGGCQAKTCRRCTQRKWSRVRKRVLAALEDKGKGDWRLMTLGGVARGTFKESRADLQKAWARFRARWVKVYGSAFVYWAAIEVGKAKGHIHLHVLVRMPENPNYSELGQWWQEVYPGAGSQGLDFSKWQCKGCHGKKNGPKRQHCGKRFGYNKCGGSKMNAKAGAAYAAKYSTKGAEFLEHAPQRAAEILAGLVGARMVRTSQRFYVKVRNQCQRCGEAYLLASEADTPMCNAMAYRREQGGRAPPEGEAVHLGTRDRLRWRKGNIGDEATKEHREGGESTMHHLERVAIGVANRHARDTEWHTTSADWAVEYVEERRVAMTPKPRVVAEKVQGELWAF